MSADIEKFDPSTLVDRVKDRIRNSIADLIPEDQWNAMVKVEIERFFKPTAKKNSWKHDDNDGLKPSTFTCIVGDALRKETEARLKVYFEGPEWAGRWTGDVNQRLASTALEEIVERQGPKIINVVIGEAIQVVVQNAIARIGQQSKY